MATPAKPTTFTIPTVNLQPYIDDPYSVQANEIVSQVATACKTSGFFQIIGHGIARELQQAVFTAAAAFFSLPVEEKKMLDPSAHGVSNRGYEVIGSQVLQEGALPDLKEVRVPLSQVWRK